MDNRKYIFLTFFGAAVFVGMSLRGLSAPLLALLEVGDPHLFGIANATTVGGVVAGLLTYLVLFRHPAVYGFTDESITELRKVTWPGRDETVRSTTIVIVCTLVIAGALGLYDFGWGQITAQFLFTER